MEPSERSLRSAFDERVPRLFEGLTRFMDRVEIVAAGLDAERSSAEVALRDGRSMEARSRARSIVAVLPNSILGLALLADASEDLLLFDEVVDALERLALRLPWRGDIWLRLGRSRLFGIEARDVARAREALERAAFLPDEGGSLRAALLLLADLDIAGGIHERAQRWLDRAGASGADGDLQVRKLECAFALHDLEAARALSGALGDGPPTDGRWSLVRARALELRGETALAEASVLRALILEAPGARQYAASLVARSKTASFVAHVKDLVERFQEMGDPTWESAFALQEGRRDDARAALVRALDAGDTTALATLRLFAIETEDIEALGVVAERGAGALSQGFATLSGAQTLLLEGREVEALERLFEVTDEASGWATRVATGVVRGWVPSLLSGEEANWSSILKAAQQVCRRLERHDLATEVAALAAERGQPLRVAIAGEFNAGKSTFINALLGQDVAPTGVLPTTATLHWLSWAPDSFARIAVRGGHDRVVASDRLKATLKELHDANQVVERVFLFAPLERLKRIEVIDTPGLNVVLADHVERARQAFQEAHLVLWLLDGSAPLKETERVVLSELARAGMPVQILVNKADRLRPDERERVLAHVAAGLRHANLASLTEPLWLSASAALRARLGQTELLDGSNWPAVERFLSEFIVDRSTEHRERALRRKGAKIVDAARDEARQRSQGEAAHFQASRDERVKLLRAASRIAADRAGIARSTLARLGSARSAFAADLRPLQHVSAERQRTDAAIAAYVTERALERFAKPVLAEILRESEAGPLDDCASVVRAAIAGAVSAAGTGNAMDESLEAVIGAAAVAVSELMAQRAEARKQVATFEVLETALEALSMALRG